MDNEKNILPYILESLNLKPNSTETYSKLEAEIQNFMSNGNENLPDVQDALKRALNKGKDLGVVFMTNDLVRLPFARKQNAEVVIEKPQSSTQKRNTKRQQKNQNKPNSEDAKLMATEKFINDFMRKMQNLEAKSRKRRRSSSRRRSRSGKRLKRP